MALTRATVMSLDAPMPGDLEALARSCGDGEVVDPGAVTTLAEAFLALDMAFGREPGTNAREFTSTRQKRASER